MDKDVVEGWLAEGLSLEEMGRRADRHPNTVRYWLTKFGLEAVGRTTYGSRGALRRDVLERLIAEDLSIRRIAVAVDRSPGTVIHWLGRYGLRTTDAARRRRSAHATSGVCSKHGTTSFTGRKDGGSSCARCRAESVTRFRRRAKRILVEESGGACVQCGYSRSLAALQFHHVDPATKRFGLARAMSSSMDSLRDEAGKCVLLCANCHAEAEHGTDDIELRGWDSNPQPLD